MKILVYGAGAIGCYLAASLAHSGNEVGMVSRPETANFIQQKGLTLSQGEQSFTVQPQLFTSPRQAFLEGQQYDLLILGMKSYDLEEALHPLVAFCPQPPPTILTIQNGIGIESVVLKDFAAPYILAGSVTTPVSRETVNHIRVEHSGRGLAIAPTQRNQKIGQWVELFGQAGLTTQALPNYQAMKWSKALLNMVGNATSAILNRLPAVVYRHRPTFNLEVAMLRETLAVMRAKKLKVVNLPGSPARQLAFAVRFLPAGLLQTILTNQVSKGRGEKLPSFYLDLSNGRSKNEVIYHNGAVAESGRELGIPTPVNAALNDILSQIVNHQIDWNSYNGQPQKLVAAVAEYRQQ